MNQYFHLTAQQLMTRLAQIRVFVTNHNATIGTLTETALREFLREHLPDSVGVAQGFVLADDDVLSPQMDIVVYDRHRYAPVYRLHDIVILRPEAVLSVIEVKTTITKSIMHDAVRYFRRLPHLPHAQTHLFIYDAKEIASIGEYLHSYPHEGDWKSFDHDTFQMLPDYVTGIDESYHLRKDMVIHDSDDVGYASWFYEDAGGTQISALQLFLESIYDHLDRRIGTQLIQPQLRDTGQLNAAEQGSGRRNRRTTSIRAIPLFPM
jgi:hypothetical protein